MKKSLTLLLALCLTWCMASAATYTVTQTTDDGTAAISGSLSWAINQATADGDVINFNLSSGDVLTLSAALPTLTKAITIEGINAATGKRVTVQVASPGVSTFRVFYIVLSSSTVTLTINDLILKGGDVSGYAGIDAYGGVVRNYTGKLIMNRCVVRDGKAYLGGGCCGRYITINQCAISNNIATNNGGGLGFENASIANIINSTITANTATSAGGGVYSGYNSVIQIINSTIAGNSSASGGGVFGYTRPGPPAQYARFYMLNSIVVNNTGNDLGNYGSPFFCGNQTWKATGTAWSVTNANAPNNATAYTAGDLGTLADNGGATPTMQLSASAPAYHTGTYAYYNATDGYYFKGTDNLYYKLMSGSTAFTPSSANPENDKITTDQSGVTRDTTPSMGACDGAVAKTSPTITWSNPADIIYGTKLSDTQLNATANVAGIFVYNPAADSILAVGNNQMLTCTFTPTDAANYATVSDTVYMNVKNEVTDAVKEETNLSLSIYPNPAINYIHINGIGTHATVTITDLNGRTCLMQEIDADNNIQLNGLAKGIYLLSIEEEGVNSRMKLIIE